MNIFLSGILINVEAFVRPLFLDVKVLFARLNEDQFMSNY